MQQMAIALQFTYLWNFLFWHLQKVMPTNKKEIQLYIFDVF